ncbi:MAG: MCE family protein [Fibrobacter sp.]|nr:MCE family protein [Fibrobacter sp.]
MSDRSLGYIVLFCLVLFLLVPTGYLFWRASAPVHTRVIEFNHFNSIEFLNIQDIVRCRGVAVGAVRAVLNKNQRVFAVIETSEHLNLYEGYQITATIKGLLGERYIDIYPGDETSSIKISPHDTLSGTFVMGAAEAVAYVENFRDILHKFMTLSHELDQGNEVKVSMVEKVNKMLSAVDSLSIILLNISKNIDSNIIKVFDSLKYYVDRGSEEYNEFSSKLPGVLSDLKNGITKTETLLSDVNQTLTKADSMITVINNPELKIWKNSLQKIQNDMDSLRLLFNNLENNGLKLPIRIRR